MGMIKYSSTESFNNQLVNGSGYEEIVLISDGDTVLKHLHISVLIVGDYYKGKHMHHCVYFEC